MPIITTSTVARPEGALEDVKEAVQRLVDLLNAQAADGVSHSGVLKAVDLTTANLEVSHQLGRVPTYYYPVALTANAVVYSDTAHADPRNFIYLRASAACSATVLIA